MTLLDLLFIALAAVTLYQLQDLKRQTNARLTTLERRDPEKRVTNPVVPGQVFMQQIENFTPKKPETLRSNQVRGREVEEREFEFDVKI